jgi:hypothetical protein
MNKYMYIRKGIKKIKSFVYLLHCFFCYYYFVIRNKYIDYFNYKKLFNDFPIFSLSKEPGIKGNKCYGNIIAVKRKMGKTYDKNCMIEHGIYFNKIVLKDECMIKSINTIYTYGEYRVEAIKEYFCGEIDKNIVPVGPYILFAKNFYNTKKLDLLKKEYGRILLVFPSHNYPDGEMVFFDHYSLIAEIEKFSKNFDTIFISLYYFDMQLGLQKIYIAKGYKIVCSGVRSDCYFLSRLKDLIQLSDMTMSNNIGTHIGYCVALNKPHYLFKQIIDESHTSNPLDENERALFYKYFGKYSEKISDDQRNLIRYFWGNF